MSVMLRIAADERDDLLVADDPSMPIQQAVDTASIVSFRAAPTHNASRYGARSTPNLPAIGLILLVHAALLFLLIQARQHYVRAKEEKLTVVNLTRPPPPPANEAPPPPPSRPEVVAPPPIVQTPVAPQQVATTPEPILHPTPVAIASPAPPSPAPPAPAFAPPGIMQGGDLGAQMVAGKPPRYPIDSRKKREQGTVVLTLVLGVDGAVESIAVSRSSGFARLDDAARDAVRRWRWKPQMQGGQPARVRGVVEIPFVLQG